MLKLHQYKVNYLDEEWVFIGSFKVGSIQSMNVAFVTSKSKSMSRMQDQKILYSPIIVTNSPMHQ